MMATWQQFSPAWQACLEGAWQSYYAGSIPIAAVVTDAEGNILSRGRNLRKETIDHDYYLSGNTLAHAELNALVRLPVDVEPHTCSLYTSTEPCPLCMGALYMSGVRQLHYASFDPWAGSTNMLGTTPYLSRKPIQVWEPQQDELEAIFTLINLEAFLNGYIQNTNEVLQKWQEVYPNYVTLAERLYQSHLLPELEASEAPAKVMTEKLTEWLASDQPGL